MEITIREAQQNRLWNIRKYDHDFLEGLSDKAIEQFYNKEFRDAAL